MNIFLWILQALLAFHTAIGATWKFSQTAEQTMPSLKAIPHEVWLAMSGIELLCAIALILPALNKFLGGLPSNVVPIAAILIAGEMLCFTGLHLFSGDTSYSPIVYWLVVAGICAFVAYGRMRLEPF